MSNRKKTKVSVASKSKTSASSKTSKTKKTAAKTSSAASTKASSTVSSPRQLKVAPYKSFRLNKKIKPSSDKKILGSFRLFRRAVLALTNNWSLFLGIIIIYGLLSVLLAGGLSAAGSGNLTQVKHNVSQNFGSFVTGVTLYADIAGSSATGSIYQTIILLLISLALIWALRQVYVEGRKDGPHIRDAFYNGMAPLVQFVLVLVVLLLELIPLTVGALLYAAAVNGNIADTGAEKSIFGFLFFLLAVASFYMLTSSAFAPYIVTLRGMTPVKALKASAQLVRYHRVRIFLKLIFVVVALIIIAGIIIVPLAIFATPAAPYVFFVLTLVFLAIFHSYVYALYRELI